MKKVYSYQSKSMVTVKISFRRLGFNNLMVILTLAAITCHHNKFGRYADKELKVKVLDISLE